MTTAPEGAAPSVRSPLASMVATGLTRLRDDASSDRVATLGAVVLAVLSLAMIARGVTFSQSGGILRLTPYAAYVLAPLVIVLACFRPWAGLVAWIVLMPVLNVARVAVSIGPVQLLLPTLILAAIAWGVWRASIRASTEREADEGPGSRVRLAARLGAVALVALALASTAAGMAPFTRSVPIALHGLIEPAALGALVVAMRPTRQRIAAIVIAMAASVAIASLLNLVRVVAVADLLTGPDAIRTQLARLTYYNVGIFGDMLAMALPLLGGALLIRRAVGMPRWASAAFVLGLAVSLVGLYLTLSKSGWLGALGSCGALLLLIVRSWRMRVGIVAVAIVLLAAVIPYPAFVLRAVAPDIAARYEQALTALNGRASSIDPGTTEGEVSVTERLYATTAALRMAVDHPVLGVGPGAFAAAYEAAYRPADSTRALDSAHDLVPYVAAEFGLLAAALVALALVGGLLLSWLAWRRADPADPLGWILPASIGAALVGFVVVSTTFGVDLYRDYRRVDSDVLFAALLVALSIALWDRAVTTPRAPNLAGEG